MSGIPKKARQGICDICGEKFLKLTSSKHCVSCRSILTDKKWVKRPLLIKRIKDGYYEN